MLVFPSGSLLFLASIFLVIFIIFLIRLFGQGLLSRSEDNKNYFVLSDVGATKNEDFNKEYKLFSSRYRSLNILLGILMVSILCLTIIFCGRPGVQTKHEGNIDNRDIMLCLDVSGSSLVFDRRILELYQSLIPNFAGERIGLQIFDSSSKTVFPLTNDYRTVISVLNNAAAVLAPIQQGSSFDTLSNEEKRGLLEFLAGTSSKSESASLIGDGLINCALSFDYDNETRSKSIIFATDNQLAGNSLYSLSEAAEFIKSKNTSLYTIFSGNTLEIGQKDEVSLKEETLSYSGSYFSLKDNSTIDSIVNKIQDAEMSNIAPDGLWSVDDKPEIFILLFLAVFSVYLLICWRLRN